MAFLQAQALVFNSPIQQAYISFLERSATGLFNMLKSFANTKRMITIAGQSKQPYMSEFSGADLENISRVIVSAGNPATRSEAGKLQVAQDLMAKGLIKDVNQYFEVLTTGQIDPMTEGPEAENMLIVKENEQLRRGLPQVAAPWDNHANHIPQHFVIMMDPGIRQKKDDPIMAATMQHVMSHAQFLFPGITDVTDPRLMALMGNNVQGVPAPAPNQPEQPTPSPVANPLPAGNGGPPRAPVLPRQTSPMVANAASQMGNAHLPQGAPRGQ
jgi:hypothetical protein